MHLVSIRVATFWVMRQAITFLPAAAALPTVWVAGALAQKLLMLLFPHHLNLLE